METKGRTVRVTIRLTPYQARELWRLRTAGLPEGAPPRPITEALVGALRAAAAALPPSPGELEGRRLDDDAGHEIEHHEDEQSESPAAR